MVTLAVAFFFAASPALGAPLSLSDTVRYAVERSPRLDSFSRERSIGEMERKNALAAFFPSLDLNSSHGYRRDRPLTQPNPWVSELNLELTENLYDNGKSLTQYKSARIQEEQANGRFKLERDKLARDVAQEFFNHSLAMKTLEVQEYQLKTLKKQVDLVASGYRQGYRTEKDYLRFRAQLSRTELSLINARTNVEKAKERLRTLIAVPVGEERSVDFLTVEENLPMRDAPASPPSLEEHPEIRLARLQSEVDGFTADLVRRRRWPELNLTTGAAWRSSGYLGSGNRISDKDRLEWSAVIGIKYNFIDWGTRSREAGVATERQMIKDNERANRELELREELNNLMRDLREKRRNYELSKELLELETKNMNSIGSDYRQGKVGYLDYVNGLDTFGDARLKFYGSLYDLQKGHYTYLYHQGTLYDALVKN